MTNSADPDQLASSNWSGSPLFAKAGHIIQVQQDKNNLYTALRSVPYSP